MSFSAYPPGGQWGSVSVSDGERSLSFRGDCQLRQRLRNLPRALHRRLQVRRLASLLGWEGESILNFSQNNDSSDTEHAGVIADKTKWVTPPTAIAFQNDMLIIKVTPEGVNDGAYRAFCEVSGDFVTRYALHKHLVRMARRRWRLSGWNIMDSEEQNLWYCNVFQG